MDPQFCIISFCASTKVQISTVNLSTRSEKNKGKRCPIFSQTLLNYECQKLQNLKFQDWQTLKIKPQVHFFSTSQSLIFQVYYDSQSLILYLEHLRIHLLEAYFMENHS